MSERQPVQCQCMFGLARCPHEAKWRASADRHMASHVCCDACKAMWRTKRVPGGLVPIAEGSLPREAVQILVPIPGLTFTPLEKKE